jgi:hypothetical protein
VSICESKNGRKEHGLGRILYFSIPFPVTYCSISAFVWYGGTDGGHTPLLYSIKAKQVQLEGKLYEKPIGDADDGLIVVGRGVQHAPLIFSSFPCSAASRVCSGLACSPV